MQMMADADDMSNPKVNLFQTCAIGAAMFAAK
jgi:hypothetical protein